MSHDASVGSETVGQEFVVPGTCFSPPPPIVENDRPIGSKSGSRPTGGSFARDPMMRSVYLTTALADIPRLLGAIDRNPYRPTYGCLDRQYWHYRTAAFPSQMYQEGVLPLALIHATKLPGNRWHLDGRVRELAIAALRYTARSSHQDGSCDDYYPYERALGAAVFSLQAAAHAYQILKLDDRELVAWFEHRCQWLLRHDETGRLTNHHALAALGLLRVSQITEKAEYREAADQRLQQVLAWQNEEGWFDEYGGADPGYQTVSIDCLAKYRRLRGDRQWDEPLQRAVAFARCFLHGDGSYAGEYGSRGTYHFYPHGMELLAAENGDAADLADGFLRGLVAGKQATFGDDRMFIHRLGNLIEAYIDWTPLRPMPTEAAAHGPSHESIRFFPHAQILVRKSDATHTVVSAARGGVFKHFANADSPMTDNTVTDAGLIVETSDGRTAVSQMHDLTRDVDLNDSERLLKTPPNTVRSHSHALLQKMHAGRAGNTSSGGQGGLPASTIFRVEGPLHWTRFETATPIKQAVFHLGMVTVGRWCRSLVRRLLQRRLIVGRRECPVRLTRTFEFVPGPKTTRHDHLDLETFRPTLHCRNCGVRC